MSAAARSHRFVAAAPPLLQEKGDTDFTVQDVVDRSKTSIDLDRLQGLRAQAKSVDVQPVAGKGGKKPSDDESGYCTIGDSMKQMASAYAVPFRDGQGADEEAARRAMMERYARAQAARK